MDGMKRGMQETMYQLDQASRRNSPEESEYWTCPTCGKQIERMYITFLKKYVFPACRCQTLELEKEEERQERLWKKRSLERAYRHNIMNEKLQRARFENFIIRPGTELIFQECKNFVQEFASRDVGLLCHGVPGNGKSHLFASIHHALDERGYVSLFLDISQLFNVAEEARKFSSKVSLPEIISAAIGCDLLTLDELGSGKLSQEEFTDILFPIINGRQGKKTNYTTNLDLDELSEWFARDKYGKPLDDKGRLIDRILGSCDVVKNNGTSKRQEDALKRMGG